MSRGLKMTPSINSFLNPSKVLNPSLKPCCANSFTSRSRTVPQCARSLEALTSISFLRSDRLSGRTRAEVWSLTLQRFERLCRDPGERFDYVGAAAGRRMNLSHFVPLFDFHAHDTDGQVYFESVSDYPHRSDSVRRTCHQL